MNPIYPDKFSFAHLPTPLEKMERLTSYLKGPQLYIKRDDQTGLATGGNKTRKLEFLLADAQAKGCDHLITLGGAQSNHCRQTAAAAAKFGFGCSLVLRGEKPKELTGNALLGKLMGAHLYWTEGREVGEVISAVTRETESLGRKPYFIPLGGSNVVGTTSYVAAMQETVAQLQENKINIDFIITASSSGGTHAGLVLGKVVTGFRGNVLGISIDVEENELKTQVASLATATAAHLQLGPVSVAEHVDVNADYLGKGYAKVGELEREAIQIVGQQEGILLDPVYTARAMGGLIDLIRWGAFTRRQSILFWHTGGQAALSAFAPTLA